jgi:hypothetical protein
MKLADWLPIVPAIQNGWSLAYATVLLFVWLFWLRRDR